MSHEKNMSTNKKNSRLKKKITGEAKIEQYYELLNDLYEASKEDKDVSKRMLNKHMPDSALSIKFLVTIGIIKQIPKSKRVVWTCPVKPNMELAEALRMDVLDHKQDSQNKRKKGYKPVGAVKLIEAGFIPDTAVSKYVESASTEEPIESEIVDAQSVQSNINFTKEDDEAIASQIERERQEKSDVINNVSENLAKDNGLTKSFVKSLSRIGVIGFLELEHRIKVARMLRDIQNQFGLSDEVVCHGMNITAKELKDYKNGSIEGFAISHIAKVQAFYSEILGEYANLDIKIVNKA